MGRHGRRKKTSPAMAIARPVIMLAVGVVAAIAMWQALTRDTEPVAASTPTEQLTQHDRQTLDRLIRDAR
jgi:hypothetical protein